MKNVLLGMCLLVSFAALAQTTTTYPNLDDNSGWYICSGSCAGGTSPRKAKFYLNQSPSIDANGSIEFYVQGGAWTDVLFYHPVGPNNPASNFQVDFYFQLSGSSARYGQAFEFDTYQFINDVATYVPGAPGPVEFMFGTQCDYSQNGGVWDIWDQYHGQWIPLYNMPCVNPTQAQFKPNVWYHVTETFHRTGVGINDPYGGMSFDSIHIVEYGNGYSNGATSDYTYNINTVEPAGPLPSGWSDQLGTQFQIDLNGQATPRTVITEYADEITLTVW